MLSYPPIDELDIGPSKRENSTEIVVRKHPEGKFMDIVDDGALGKVSDHTNKREMQIFDN